MLIPLIGRNYLKMVNQLISFLERNKTLTDKEVVQLTRESTGLLVLFFFDNPKVEIIKQLKYYNANFMHLPEWERPSILCQKGREFRISDVYSQQ